MITSRIVVSYARERRWGFLLVLTPSTAPLCLFAPRVPSLALSVSCVWVASGFDAYYWALAATQLNIASPATGSQMFIEIDDEKKL